MDLPIEDGTAVVDTALEVLEEEVDGAEEVGDLVEQEGEPPVQDQEDVDVS